MRALFALARGALPLEQALALADTAEEPRKLRAEAYFHAAARVFGTGDRAQAVGLLRDAYLSFDGELGYTYHAKALLMKLESDPDWPTWAQRDGLE